MKSHELAKLLLTMPNEDVLRNLKHRDTGFLVKGYAEGICDVFKHNDNIIIHFEECHVEEGGTL